MEGEGTEHQKDVAHDGGGEVVDNAKVGAEGSDEVVAGNPQLVEEVTTGLQLETAPESTQSEADAALHPITLLPAPLHLDSHPADSLHPPDSPTTSLISSLRSQLHLLTEQAQQLNNKLVTSISRGADLEDQLYTLQSAHVARGEEVKVLQKAKEQWEESMNTGLLVERSQIKEEMQRLASGLVEEERRRGSAEEKRFQVENEVDNLTASLFDQANTMVAAERLGRLEAEKKLLSTEVNLANAEAAVKDLQIHFQSLSTSVAVEPQPKDAPTTVNRKYLSSHIPYNEFLIFIQHLRALRPLKDTSKAVFPPPVITNLMAQPFIARSAAEDHEPTLRLDLAPDLSWLSRRSVGQAIIAGELIIEPVSASSVIASSNAAIADIGCSLCGKPVFPSTIPPSPVAGGHFGAPPTHPTNNTRNQSRFSLKPFFNAAASPSQSGTTSPSHSPLTSPAAGYSYSSLPSVYIFRIAKPPATGINTAASQANEKEAKSYPLCKSGWCLERLRATCELWHFVRTGIIHVVWHGDDGYILPSEGGNNTNAILLTEPATRERLSSTDSSSSANHPVVGEAPSLPPRKKSGWGLGFGLKERSGSSGGWGKSLYKGTASPPVSPKLEKEGGMLDQQPQAQGISNEVSPLTIQGEGTLGAPLELEDGVKEIEVQEKESLDTTRGEAQEPTVVEQKEGKDVETVIPSIQEPEASPVVDASKPEEKEEAITNPDDDDAALHAPVIQRTDSTPSINGSEVDDADFSTPKGTNADLSPDPSTDAPESDETAAPKTEIEAKPSQDVVLNSPSGDRKPPPIPRRAAARDRASQLLSGTSTPIGTNPEAITVEGVEKELASGQAEPEDKESKAEAEAEDTELEPKNLDDPEPEPRNSTSSTSTSKPPPPLPARHPRTPTQQITDNSPADGEKTYLGDEGWEVKTWKQVLKIKEEMWKARVGVVDDGCFVV